MPIGSCPFQRDLIRVSQMFAPGEVTAKQCIASGTDNEFIAGIIPAPFENSALHGGQYVAFKRTCMDGFKGGIPCVIGKTGGGADIIEFRRAFDNAQFRYQTGCVGKRAETVKCCIKLFAIGGGQPIGIVFNAKFFAATAKLCQHVAQLQCRVHIRAIDPDTDIFDVGCMLCLTQVRCAGNKGNAAVSPQIQALEKDITERVIPRQIEHAFLAEHQQAIKTGGFKTCNRFCAAGRQFGAFKMQCHGGFPDCDC